MYMHAIMGGIASPEKMFGSQTLGPVFVHWLADKIPADNQME